jgi:hypothetical protein
VVGVGNVQVIPAAVGLAEVRVIDQIEEVGRRIFVLMRLE